MALHFTCALQQKILEVPVPTCCALQVRWSDHLLHRISRDFRSSIMSSYGVVEMNAPSVCYVLARKSCRSNHNVGEWMQSTRRTDHSTRSYSRAGTIIGAGKTSRWYHDRQMFAYESMHNTRVRVGRNGPSFHQRK